MEITYLSFVGIDLGANDTPPGEEEQTAAWNTIIAERIVTSRLVLSDTASSPHHLQVQETGQTVRYHCPHCSYVGGKLSNVSRHQAAVHQRLRFRCDACSYSASKMDLLRRHRATRHADATMAAAATGQKVLSRSNKNAAGRQKRPPNPYLLFCRESAGQIRRELQEVQPPLSLITTSDVSRALGRRWKALGEPEQARYRERYAALLAAHREKNSNTAENNVVDSAAAPPPRTPFLLYTRTVYSR